LNSSTSSNINILYYLERGTRDLAKKPQESIDENTGISRIDGSSPETEAVYPEKELIDFLLVAVNALSEDQ
jgi:hypothetical protein